MSFELHGGTSLVKVPKKREAFARLMTMGEDQLRILNSNSQGTLERDPLFRVLLRKGDSPNLSKFFTRTLTEESYRGLSERHAEEIIGERVKEAAAEGKAGEAPKTEPAATPGKEGPIVKQKALVRKDGETRSLSRIIGALGGKGWTNLQIANGLAVCRDLDLPNRKLTKLAILDVDPANAATFLRAHLEMKTVGLAAANSHYLFSLDVLVQIFELVGKDEDRFTDFLDFCTENPHLAGRIHDEMQLGNRGRLRDLTSAIRKLIKVYDTTYSVSEDIEDIEFLDEMGAERRDFSTDRHARGLDDTEIDRAAELEDHQAYLELKGIECADQEERLAPDEGNFNILMRRRRGGF